MVLIKALNTSTLEKRFVLGVLWFVLMLFTGLEINIYFDAVLDKKLR